jgi:hypothetical protein
MMMRRDMTVALFGLLLASQRAAMPLPPAPSTQGLTVVLLLDVSASMTHVPLPLDARYAQVYNAFAQGLRPEDRAAIGVMASSTRFGPLTSNPKELSASVRRLLQAAETDRLGPSPLWDGALSAMPMLGSAGGPSALLLFSDGKSTGNVHGLDELIAQAVTQHVSVNAVLEGAGTVLLARAASALDAGDAIEKLTTATGGRRLLDRPPDPRQRNPGPLISVIMDALHR